MMGWDAGQLDKLIEIHRLAAGRDALGQPSGGYTKLADEWASKRQLGGLEQIKAGAVTSVEKASLRIRYRVGYSTSDRVIADGITYDIKSIAPDNVGRRWTDLVCESVL
jgi:SPP1 family predicted phage head-tail adaptor